MSELKTLDSRINKAINSAHFVDVTRNKHDMALKTSVTKDEFVKSADASVKSINDLISRRNSIKSAILISNATAKVKIDDKEYTVIEAIERKNSIQYERSYLDKMRMELQKCRHDIEANRVQVDANIQRLVEASYGREAKPSKEDFDAIADPQRKQHDLKLLDPCKIDELIQNLDEKIDNFLKEVDICLTESNSRTEIEVQD
jgi:hypothetical protein